jgi:two-component system, NtrC family, sensor kinase
MKEGTAETAAATRRFRLVRFFTTASLGALLLVGLALALQERQQGAFFSDVQERQNAFFADAQQRFAREQQEAARRDLIATQEGGSVNVARLFANVLWAPAFAPFVAKAQALPLEACRAIPDAIDAAGKSVPDSARKACFAQLGARLRAMPEFNALDAKVFDIIKGSTVFKIKAYDVRGLTVYSSDPSQMGEDKSANPGWRQAASGRPASQISHRDTFSAFEGVVNDRDLLESYVPVKGGTGDEVVGVFEIYSDITPFLARIKATAAQTAAASAANLARAGRAAAENEAAADQQAARGLLVIAGMLAALFVALFLVARRAERIITSQARDRDALLQRLGQSEKMVALGQMVAGVAHQLNTPLAFSQSNVSLVIDRLGELDAPVRVASRLTQLVRACSDDPLMLRLGRSRAQVAAIASSPQDVATMREMLQDVLGGIAQMSELVVNMREFTRLDRESQAEADLNHGLKTVVYMARSVVPSAVRIVEHYGELPRISCNPSQLNQVFLNLITNAAQAIDGGGTVAVRSSSDAQSIRIDVADTGSGIPPEVLPRIFESFYTTKPRGVGTGLGLSIALEIVRAHGGDIEVKTEVGGGTTFTVVLPVVSQAEMRLAA